MNYLIISAVLMLGLLSGCGWSGTPTRINDITPLTSITISADYSTIAKSTSLKLRATGNYSGLFTRDITDRVIWLSDVASVAAFNSAAAPNRVNGVAPGTAVITAAMGSVSASYPLTVSSATITALAITPAAPTIAKGLSTQFVVSGVFSDASSQVLTGDASWASSDPVVATISDADSSKGFVKALSVGTSTISATFDGVPVTTLLTVFEPVVQSIALTPPNPSILTISTGNIKAIGTYSDRSTADISSQVTWNSSDTDKATIAADGTITTFLQGTATISATLGTVSQSTSLKVTGGNLTGITISPATVTLVKETAGRISATGTFSNGSSRDITGAVAWTSANTAIATVSRAGGAAAWLNPLALTAAPTAITATSGTLSATASLTVTAPQLLSIALSSTSLDLTAGTGTPLALSASFSDGTIQDVTNLAVWTSSDSTKASVDAGGLGTERVFGAAAGFATISATYGGKTVPTPANVTVRSRTLQSLTISPASSSLTVGNPVSFIATAGYGDGTTVDVTSHAVWSVNSSNVAILTDTANLPGQVVGVDSGSVTLTANFGDKSEAVTITVTGP